ncbi:MAG: HIT family protein [Bryobacteraceae bacterium]|nr:HIT family protein [Bryobacteraceae bacterium]
MKCAFCDVIAGGQRAAVIYEDDFTFAFLDHRPVFPGHVLLVPKRHVETLPGLPDDLLQPLFAAARMLSGAVVKAMEAEGSFVAMNNHVSQSVPHLHVHIVPRRKGDGLRGFFWPRQKYRDEQHLQETRRKLILAIAS